MVSSLSGHAERKSLVVPKNQDFSGGQVLEFGGNIRPLIARRREGQNRHFVAGFDHKIRVGQHPVRTCHDSNLPFRSVEREGRESLPTAHIYISHDSVE